MVLSEITSFLESWAPLSLQESYDNSGLLLGNPNQDIHRALICLDVTEEVIDEAMQNGCNLIIAHHPLIFGGLKRITGSNTTERIVRSAIKNEIAIYAIHTNLDNITTGVNSRIAAMLGLRNCHILESKKGLLKKLVTFCPDVKLENGQAAPEKLRQALWEAGAGQIGHYDRCSFNLSGIGTYRPLEGSDPFIGEKGKTERQAEVRIEVIFPAFRQKEIVRSLLNTHPYEEVAYDIFSLDNESSDTGAGMIGELTEEMEEMEFLHYLKYSMQTGMIRHSPLPGRKVKKVAVCGGSGSFLLKKAIAKGADVFVTGDFKYHQFFDAEGRIIIADIGHYESERFTIDLLFERLTEKFSTFALLKSKVNTNPINYL